ncbi:hypothetical protein RISK_004057 [Rhodopirellula islandica]|uniref:Uncharacterized protein n=1 Tax=Rhodopirellula islandica TaxID=595434 RepID=A0A0J1BAA0_RHOIS|nr:hypothetical protein RISK_004057 [Rhodopirellula islandica]
MIHQSHESSHLGEPSLAPPLLWIHVETFAKIAPELVG